MPDPTENHEGSTEVDGERRDDSPWGNRKFLAVSLIIGSALLEYGFDQGMVSGFQAMPGFLMVFGYRDETAPGGWNIHSGPQQIISSFMILGSFIGSLLIGVVEKFLGRRYSLMAACVIMIAANTIMILTTSMGLLYFGRLLLGISNGFLFSFSQLYIQESSPAKLRGLCFALLSSWNTVGTLIGNAINSRTSTIMSRLSYQIPLFVLYGLPVFLLIMLPFLPESPRYLLLHGKEEDALKSLRWLRGNSSSKAALKNEFAEAKMAIQIELELKKTTHFLDLFKGTNLRRTLICCGVVTCNAGVGAMYIIAFGTYLFVINGIKEAFRDSVIANCLGLVGLYTSFFLVDRFGRRMLLLLSCAICGVMQLVMAIVFTTPLKHSGGGKIALVALVCVYKFGFNLGLGPCTFLVAGELPSQGLRGSTLGLSVASGFVFGWLTAFTTPYFINPADLNWGPRYGYIWFGSTVICVLFIYICVPEARKRSLDELNEMFNNRVPSRQFRTYQCTSADDARKKETDIEDEKNEVSVVTKEHV